MQKLIRTLSSGLLVAALLTPGVASAAGGFLPYKDIGTHWAKASIIRGVQAGLFAAGADAPMFYPNREMTRAEFVALMDRLYSGGQYQLYPLTFLSEHAEWSKGEGFDEPYLPYKDVDRLTWMYNPTLRVSVILDRLYGPNAIQEVFPGEAMNPNQPITREEAAKLMQMFTMSPDSAKAWEEVRAWGWLEGERSDKLKRGEAAAAADRMITYLVQDTILPLLDYDGQKFPMVPEIEELFPYFATYTIWSTTEEKAYVEAVDAIRNHEDTDQTFQVLRKLLGTSFDNRIGLHFYLSWDPETEISANLDEAMSAIDAYFADKVIAPDTLRLLSANVYDLALQLGANDPQQFAKVLDRLSTYEAKVKPDSKEWEALAIYLGALEIRSGQTEKALSRYKQFAAANPEALLNACYYLHQDGRLEEAAALLATVKPNAADTRMVQLGKLLQQELASLQEQTAIVSDLGYSLRRLDSTESYQVKGEAVLSGFTFKYTQEIDQRSQISKLNGFYQSPQKLVSDKLSTYTDGRKHIQYSYDSESQKWEQHKTDKLDFLHEWVSALPVAERAKTLHARYFKQSFGEIDVITEWIPGAALEEKSASLMLERGKVKHVPLFMNKYYIDRASDRVVKHTWRYEEIYSSDEYVAYSGTDRYDYAANVKLSIPDEVRKGVTP
ncbi:S-layer homology domain-containing protein [Brevibacillus agri]|uniref:S-layer homology domain-containing protein n=1 Tax=Brevibacillus agri TaxID=51101 RepID=UPI0024C03883|nr:S-layer homology domain-containing protein [Brevibacillus agri]MED4570903.1 S-layer homology domain-containing protein [Brevibacillus agri]WHX32635.1 S-layer homology domain-containing protein [Brevibacillus agri]